MRLDSLMGEFAKFLQVRANSEPLQNPGQATARFRAKGSRKPEPISVFSMLGVFRLIKSWLPLKA